MKMNPDHPWAPAKRSKDCYGYKIDRSMLEVIGQRAEAFKGCMCLWCLIASKPNQPLTFSPICTCDTCENHILLRKPEHFSRFCGKHGQRWTAYKDEPDDCFICRLDSLDHNLKLLAKEVQERIAELTNARAMSGMQGKS